jgi:Fe-S cluster assembly protein SufD
MNQKTELEAFESLLEKQHNALSQLNGRDALQKIRSRAWELYVELGLPKRENEVYRYIRLKNLYSESYSFSASSNVLKEKIVPYIYPECAHSFLVFVNGFFNPDLSNTTDLPPRIVIRPLKEAAQTYGTFLNNQWGKTMKEETDPFAALNVALHPEGAFIYIPPKTQLDIPIQILNVVAAENESTLLMPRTQFFIGAQSEITVISTQAILSEKKYFINQSVDFTIEEDSHLHYIQRNEDTEDGWNFSATRATLKRNSTFKKVCVTQGGGTIRNDYRILLTGENAEALLNGISMLSNKRESHTHVVMDHQAPNCRSMQLYKNVLNHVSRSCFEGKILVRQAAQKTQAFQLNNNLLLSDRAHADSKPNLEIFADDVKASHGATIGQLDPEHLFYLKTRGLSEAEAKNSLVYGFCKEVIDMLSIPSTLKEVDTFAQNYVTKID